MTEVNSSIEENVKSLLKDMITQLEDRDAAYDASTLICYEKQIINLYRNIHILRRTKIIFENHLRAKTAPSFLDYKYFIRPDDKECEISVKDHNDLIQEFQRDFLVMNIKFQNDIIKKFESNLRKIRSKFYGDAQKTKEHFSKLSQKARNSSQQMITNSSKKLKENRLTPFKVEYKEDYINENQIYESSCCQNKLNYTKNGKKTGCVNIDKSNIGSGNNSPNTRYRSISDVNQRGRGGTNQRGSGGANQRGKGNANQRGKGGTNQRGRGGTNQRGRGGTKRSNN